MGHEVKASMTCVSWSSELWLCILSWRLFDVCASYFRSMNQYDPAFDLKINVGHCDLYFLVLWLCLIPWRLFDVWTSLIGIMNQYGPTHDLKINVGHHDLCFMVQWFCLISWRLFDVFTSYFPSMNQYDPAFDLKINVGHCDLYFMVQWLCLLPWRLFHVGTSLFGFMNPYDLMHDLKNKCRSLWPIFHSPVILPYILTTWCMCIILSEYESVQPKCRSLWSIFHGPVIVPFTLKTNLGLWIGDLMHDLKINVGHCAIFHGPTILCYTLKTVWCMNIILGDYGSVWQDVWPLNKCMSLWPIFHDPLIFPYISKDYLMDECHLFR